MDISHTLVINDQPRTSEPSGPCANCGKHEATQRWIGDGGSLAYIHGMYSFWCECCVFKEQLRYARERAAAIPELERQLAAGCVTRK